MSAETGDNIADRRPVSSNVIPLEQMNTIEAVIGNSEFVPVAHLLFVIDGVPLDHILSETFPDRNLKGLIPTTLNWLESSKEQAEVWKRFSNRDSDHEFIPVLCCPDDLDFLCTLVVVHAQFDDGRVKWLQFGFDTTSFDRLPDAVGSSVEWFDGVGPFVFERKQYETMARRFEQLGRQTENAG